VPTARDTGRRKYGKVRRSQSNFERRTGKKAADSQDIREKGTANFFLNPKSQMFTGLRIEDKGEEKKKGHKNNKLRSA